MNNIIPIIYLSTVCIILIPISYLITVQVLKFIYETYILKILEKKNYYKKYSKKEYRTLLQIYKKHRLWTLAINNIENALELRNTISNKVKIYYVNEISFIYKQINYKKLSLKYYKIVSELSEL
uniref:Uncharacterized protein n=1 Tax=Lympha mucosa TaxID=2045360 RepID=A0A6B9VPB1_9FLOR|nr:hypothetical protein [Lympha mucosa]